MAGHEEQGTGKHKHKSTEEPYPHHEAPTTRGEGRGNESRSESRGSESRSESRGHESHSENRSSGSSSHSGGSHSGGREESRGSNESRGQNESSDLKSREYRGPDGEIHHHTRTYEEQHKGGK